MKILSNLHLDDFFSEKIHFKFVVYSHDKKMIYKNDGP
jgi:hypothetical protein